MVGRIYAAACCTLQTTQGTSATQSKGYSFAFQISQKLCRLSHDWDIELSVQFWQFKRFVLLGKHSMWSSVNPGPLDESTPSSFGCFSVFLINTTTWCEALLFLPIEAQTRVLFTSVNSKFH